MKNQSKFGSNPLMNLELLKQNSYPGRGIILGLDENGENMIQVYWIMGRSENSRNRVFKEEENGVLKTVPANPETVKDPSLTIYTAMVEDKNGNLNLYAVSNGSQTEDVLKSIEIPDWKYEPDAPNFTPRISGFSYVNFGGDPAYKLSILLKESADSDKCIRKVFSNLLEPGFGNCITTYEGDGDPLPSFHGEPYPLFLPGDIHEVKNQIWESLNEENRISLAVKFINIQSGDSQIEIVNKYK